MSIKYFFIAGAVTISLSLALQSSGYTVAQKHTPFITHSTVNKNNFTVPNKSFTIKKKNLHLIEQTSGTFDEENIQNTRGVSPNALDDFYIAGKNLLYAIYKFLRSVVMLCIQTF
ncbi:hypothetical protein [Bartonella sp. CB175]|uniref:hypothetical protein n=1 Tax=Bartonella sp. CB175 TaxID=3112256 RepID=UPI00300E5C5B